MNMVYLWNIFMATYFIIYYNHTYVYIGNCFGYSGHLSALIYLSTMHILPHTLQQ